MLQDPMGRTQAVSLGTVWTCVTQGMFCSSYEGAISSSRRQVKKVPPSGRRGLEIPHKLGGLVLNPGDAMTWVEHD